MSMKSSTNVDTASKDGRLPPAGAPPWSRTRVLTQEHRGCVDGDAGANQRHWTCFFQSSGTAARVRPRWHSIGFRNASVQMLHQTGFPVYTKYILHCQLPRKETAPSHQEEVHKTRHPHTHGGESTLTPLLLLLRHRLRPDRKRFQICRTSQDLLKEALGKDLRVLWQMLEGRIPRSNKASSGASSFGGVPSLLALPSFFFSPSFDRSQTLRFGVAEQFSQQLKKLGGARDL